MVSGRASGAGQDEPGNGRNRHRDGSRTGQWARERRYGGVQHDAHHDYPAVNGSTHGHTKKCPGRQQLRHTPSYATKSDGAKL